MNNEIIDLSGTVEAKSDQMNAIDLIGGSKTVVITAVKKVDDVKQPVFISYEGDNGKPYKPCLGMRRILIVAWGSNGAAYVGRSMTLFNNPDVIYAGKKAGGIQISHLSNIDKKINTMLAITRGKRILYIVQPLITFKGNDLQAEEFEQFEANMAQATNMAELALVGKEIANGKYNAKGKAALSKCYKEAVEKIRDEE